MCGRYTSLDPDEMAEVFRVVRVEFNFPTRNYDVKPGAPVPAVRLGSDGKRELVGLKWMWKHERYAHCNAKAENVARLPAYRSALKSRRCIVPSRGFYEWLPLPGSKLKQRYYIERIDGAPLAFPGLFSEDGSMMATITVPPNKEISEIHDRTPVSLAPEDWERYLSPEPLTDEERKRMLATPPDGIYRYWPVALNAPGAEQIKEVSPLKIPPADAPLPTRPRRTRKGHPSDGGKAKAAPEGDLFGDSHSG